MIAAVTVELDYGTLFVDLAVISYGDATRRYTRGNRRPWGIIIIMIVNRLPSTEQQLRVYRQPEEDLDQGAVTLELRGYLPSANGTPTAWP